MPAAPRPKPPLPRSTTRPTIDGIGRSARVLHVPSPLSEHFRGPRRRETKAMMGNESAFQRAMKLAIASGLKTTFGPALVAAARDRPERDTLAMAAMAEMVLDKLPLM